LQLPGQQPNARQPKADRFSQQPLILWMPLQLQRQLNGLPAGTSNRPVSLEATTDPFVCCLSIH
jgi:hypothetical protein